MRRFSLRNLSIQQRLPLLISVLLFFIITVFGWVSYLGVKKAAIAVGSERLHSLTEHLGQTLSQSTKALITATHKAADQQPVKDYLLSNGESSFAKALGVLQKLRPDSTWPLVELTDINRKTVLSTGHASIKDKVDLDTIFANLPHNPDSCKIGKLYTINDSVYYPVISEVSDQKKIIGYLVRWRLQRSTPKAIAQVAKLLGTDATLSFGNKDGTLWTDMMKPVTRPPVDTMGTQMLFEYTSLQGTKVLAAVQPIANTQWLVVVEFSKQKIMEAANRFLGWLIIAGSIVVAVGSFIAWLMSRNITEPLNELTGAARAIAAGNFSPQAKVSGGDEIGELALAFSSMAVKVHNAQEHLEKEVMERTRQLEIINKELEAFSYSISHDLRAPLRAVIGFTSMLEEDYGSKFDDEARRLTSVIKNNTLKMSHLVDGLLSFSKMERQDIIKTKIHTAEMVKEVIDSFRQQEKQSIVTWVVGPLPDCKADIIMIRQVWINLISNAVKYSSNTSLPVIEIGSFMHEDQTAYFVKDNGVGFNEKYRDKLFKVFQRLHSSEEFKGTGIGLAIVEKIISKHGGKVWAEAEIKKGACFYFSLPVE